MRISHNRFFLASHVRYISYSPLRSVVISEHTVSCTHFWAFGLLRHDIIRICDIYITWPMYTVSLATLAVHAIASMFGCTLRPRSERAKTWKGKRNGKLPLLWRWRRAFVYGPDAPGVPSVRFTKGVFRKSDWQVGSSG